MSAPPQSVPSVLIPELIGFTPQFLLDDIINTANDSVKKTVEAMETFLRRWAESRTEAVDGEWDSTQEVEQGLVSFQTLLESHVDIAFDFFEAWSLRNIFAIPVDLPIVAPHLAGLNLEQPPEKEAELLSEIDDLRRKIQAVSASYINITYRTWLISDIQQKKLQRLYTRAVAKSATQLTHSHNCLQKLDFLRSPQLQAMLALPPEFLAMYLSISALPPPNESIDTEPLSVAAPEPGKRPWETSRTGYVNWAIEQLLARTKARKYGTDGDDATPGEASSVVGQMAAAAHGIATAENMKAALDEIVDSKNNAHSMDTH